MPKRIIRTQSGILAIIVGTGLIFASTGLAMETDNTTRQAVFAGGCFWCLESDFDKLKGVLDAESGYAGGATSHPNYKTYSKNGHYEVVRVTYDPAKVSYYELVEYFWRQVDPTDAGGQFCDRGKSYSTGIFVTDSAEKTIAQASRKALQEAGILSKKIVTPIFDLGPFWSAEARHQDYAQRNSWRYKYYRNGCGRDKRLKSVWRKDTYKKPS